MPSINKKLQFGGWSKRPYKEIRERFNRLLDELENNDN